MKRYKVGLLYSAKSNAPHEGEDDTPWDKWNELDSEQSISGYVRALESCGHEVIPMEGDPLLVERLERYKPDICFNTCEGHRARSREAQVPAILDMLGIPYTGSGVMTLSIALDKAMTKRVLQFYSIPTPGFQVFITGAEQIDPRLTFPLFAKPALEGSGIGITAKSVCRTPGELRDQVKYLLRAYKEPVLVEEYIEGREVTAGLLGNIMPRGAWIKERRRLLAAQAGAGATAQVEAGQVPGDEQGPRSAGNGNGRAATSLRDFYHQGLRVLPPMEVDFSPLGEGTHLYDSEIKGKNPWGPRYIIPAPLSGKLGEQINRLTVATFRALECYDFARVDFRIRASDGKPFVLEINPLAGLSEGLSDLVLEAEAAGLNYAQLINGILDAALRRYGMLEES